MKVTALESVTKFIDSQELSTQEEIHHLIFLLMQYGHSLSMPYAKPIGSGLWELRKTGRPQIRILYGFCGGDALLLLAFKKQRAAVRQSDIALAVRRLKTHCR